MITLYGRTYWDAQVSVPLAMLTQGKGKLDTRVSATIGGFAWNAARALVGRFPPGRVRVVTLTSRTDEGMLRFRAPANVALAAIESDDVRLAAPAISVIINPATQCRILRDPMEHTDDLWQVEGVSQAALSAKLHVLGRLPEHFAASVLDAARTRGAKVAWCGGETLPEELEQGIDYLCVNAVEANRMLGTEGESPRACAEALAQRATVDRAVRLVTGRGAAPTTAAVRGDGEISYYESAPTALEPGAIKTLFRVGDVFAANFLASACFDGVGIAEALALAQDAATHFIQTEDFIHG